MSRGPVPWLTLLPPQHPEMGWRVLWYGETALAVEIGASWGCSMTDNNPGTTSETKVRPGSCLGCCSATREAAHHPVGEEQRSSAG